MTQPTITPLAPAEAIASLTARGLRLDPSFGWQDAWQADHATMFTVAKSAGFDILKDIHDGLTQALAEGTTFETFAKNLRPALEAKGWWGRKEVVDPTSGEIQERTLGSTRRLRTIFDTNMRVSYAAGHWEQFDRNRRSRPVLRYVAILDGRVRPAHRARHNLTLPIDDPYWDTWAPPCGWGCRCTLQSLSLRDVERMRGELKFTPPPETIRTFTNKRTGEVAKVPDGIDPGWAYNPGKAGWQASTVAGKLPAAPPVMAAAATADPSWPAAKLADEFGSWLDQASAKKPVPQSPWTVGALDRPVLDALAHQGVAVQTGAIAVEAPAAPEILMPVAGSAGAVRMVRRLPEILATPKAVLWDKAAGELAYVFGVPGDDVDDRLVVRVKLGPEVAPDAATIERLRPNLVASTGIFRLAALVGSVAYTLLTGSL
ncbi:phage minor head protein [Methylobacterium sp. WL6]|uniref:phage head morphogenesis protein n=1 Tax=Methylobacterium sp. WL6 TaxID=2603901 RepID=UPI0011CC4BDB|nr:phage minor head protein [Methylobacterium sp. WL6]TXN71645.1 hypothetical protein FV230_07810 [Methylobacterium sp. WL6]